LFYQDEIIIKNESAIGEILTKIDTSIFSEFSKGAYMLLVFVSKDLIITIGKLGKQKFPKGYYIYFGSALGNGATNLKHRIIRHLKKEKNKYWHIDYFLENKNVFVKAIMILKTNKNMECDLNRYIKNNFSVEILIDGFGASDCKNKCRSHLFYFKRVEVADSLIQNTKLYKFIDKI
jgi:Uri superfamily endonuclease